MATSKEISRENPKTPALPREELGKLAAPIADARNIFEVVAACLNASGYAGNPAHGMAIYAALTSRILEKPMSVVVKASSSAGKSYLMNSVLALIPPEEKVVKSGLSPKALAYGKEPLVHKVLAIQEASGAGGPEGYAMLRTLISEGVLSYEVTEKHGDKFATRTVTREGPIAFAMTTTMTLLHREDETRFLSINVEDSSEHTAKVLREMGAAAKGRKKPQPIDLEAFHAFQLWLAAGPREVIIPFGLTLSANFSPVLNRGKRDFDQVLQCIRVSALMHQANRQRDDMGRVVATWDDYEMVRAFLNPILSETLGAMIPADIRLVVETVGQHGGDSSSTPHRGVTLAELRDLLGKKGLMRDPSNISRLVTRAKEGGWIEDRGMGKGYPSRLIQICSMPDDREALIAQHKMVVATSAT
jgi:hypothetical protein